MNYIAGKADQRVRGTVSIIERGGAGRWGLKKNHSDTEAQAQTRSVDLAQVALGNTIRKASRYRDLFGLVPGSWKNPPPSCQE